MCTAISRAHVTPGTLHRSRLSGRGRLARHSGAQAASATGDYYAAKALADAGQPLRILDIAAGHGRYVLDAVGALPTRPDSIVLRDFSELNVQAGRALIAARGLGDIARFEAGDAFDADRWRRSRRHRPWP